MNVRLYLRGGPETSVLEILVRTLFTLDRDVPHCALAALQVDDGPVNLSCRYALVQGKFSTHQSPFSRVKAAVEEISHKVIHKLGAGKE